MAGGDELTLLGFWGSPFVLRARLALSFKGLSYQYVEEDLKNKSELLLKSNPVLKKVPVLIHNGKPICETQIIVQYLDDVYGATTGPSLLPADPYDRAMARFWAAYIDDKLLGSFLMISMGNSDEEREEGMKQSFAAAEILEEALKECSKGRPFFGGDSVGYVDIVLGGFVPWVHLIDRSTGSKQFDAGKTPLLAAWLEHFGSLDAAKAVMPDLERMVALSKTRQA
ncbi:unnamed protein product [Urochloa decumbens]|uniref:Glutathione S-transferase n=1 Tax=Urochloa decumbens TaxID=240449 RepID=A0ABC8XBG6_9POAL